MLRSANITLGPLAIKKQPPKHNNLNGDLHMDLTSPNIYTNITKFAEY